MMWREEAACRGRLGLFIAPSGERPSAREFREMRAAEVCGACPVLMACRDDARENGEPFFRAGETEAERVKAGFPVRQVGWSESSMAPTALAKRAERARKAS